MTRVGLTAAGCVCAAGVGAQTLWDGLLAGRSFVAPSPCFLEGTAPVGRVPDDALPARGEDRALTLLSSAAAQIEASSAWSRVAGLDPARVGLCVGTTQGPIETWTADQARLREDPTHRPATPALAGPVHALAARLGIAGPLACPSMACASSTAAIGIAMDWLRDGRCDAAVAGGVDSLSAFVHQGFKNLRALDPARPRPFDARRAGLCLGEGAGLVLLEAGANAEVQLLGRGLSSDANHITGPDPSGAGVARAMAAALRDAGLTPAEVGFVNAHGTATVFNDLMEAKALHLALGERARAVPVNSIKGALGHSMGAAGALEAVLCSLVLRRGRIPPTANLEQLDPAIDLDVVQGAPRTLTAGCVISTSSGFGGINAALVLGPPEMARN